MLKFYPETSSRFTKRLDLYNYIHGGKAVVKLEAPSGNSHTYVISQPNERSAFPDDVYFVYALHDNEKQFYIGMIEQDRFRLTKNSRFHADTDIAKGAKYIVRLALEDKLFNSTPMSIYHGGCCARCGRRLESGRSLLTGFGPKCIKKL